MKRTVLLMMTVLLLSLTGCGKYEQIQILSGKVESLNMSGLRSAVLIMDVEVSNPAGKVVLEDVDGTVKHFGKVLGCVSLAPLELKARSVGKYRVEAAVTLERGVGLMELMGLMDVKRLRECTVDISAKGKAAGVRMKREYRDIPLKKLLEDHDNEKI